MCLFKKPLGHLRRVRWRVDTNIVLVVFCQTVQMRVPAQFRTGHRMEQTASYCAGACVCAHARTDTRIHTLPLEMSVCLCMLTFFLCVYTAWPCELWAPPAPAEMNDVHGQVVWERRIRRERRGLCMFCKVRGFQDGRLPPPRHGRDLGAGAPPSCIGHLHSNNDENSRDSVEDFVCVTAYSLVHGPTVQLLQPAAYIFVSLQPRDITDTCALHMQSRTRVPCICKAKHMYP